MLKKIELWLWRHNLHPLTFQGIRFYPVGGGAPAVPIIAGIAKAAAPAIISSAVASAASRKQAKAASQATQEAEALSREQMSVAEREAQEIKAAGLEAGRQIRTAGQPTAEEEERRLRYRGKALTPGEQLMQEAGPISQAVARRIQERTEAPGLDLLQGDIATPLRARIRERIERPGLDYLETEPAFREEISLPLWRALKQRGIYPSEGGLGLEQYMKGAVPVLARARQEQIARDIEGAEQFAGAEAGLKATDIERGRGYSEEARRLQEYYQGLENVLAEAIRNRLYESGITAAEAEQRGKTAGGTTLISGRQAALEPLADLLRSKWELEETRRGQATDALANVLLGGLGNIAGIFGKGTSKGTLIPSSIGNISQSLPSPYERQLESRLGGSLLRRR